MLAYCMNVPQSQPNRLTFMAVITEDGVQARAITRSNTSRPPLGHGEPFVVWAETSLAWLFGAVRPVSRTLWIKSGRRLHVLGWTN